MTSDDERLRRGEYHGKRPNGNDVMWRWVVSEVVSAPHWAKDATPGPSVTIWEQVLGEKRGPVIDMPLAYLRQMLREIDASIPVNPDD